MKKILFLGGANQQIVAIQYAKDQGYYTVLCDYLEDNPGQHYADEFHCVSTTDKKAVLEVAKHAKIDGIVAYASEPAAATAAYVGNNLNLPSNLYESVLLLTKKNLFRNFLVTNDFNCPNAKSFTSAIEAKEALSEFQFPLMVKPVDSSGSRGVTRIDAKEEFDDAFEYAVSKSENKVVIIEEYIEMAHECMIGGDLFVINGEIVYFGFLNGYRNIKANSYIPFGNSYPIFIEEEKIVLIRKELQRVINLLKIEMGPLNIEIMFDKSGKLYIIEIGPRNGGNMIPELLKLTTGVDLVKATVETALNNITIDLGNTPTDAYCSTYYLHSFQKGELENIVFKDEIEKNIVKKVINKKKGDEIEIFNGADKIIGVIFLEFSSLEEMKNKMRNMNHYIDIQLK